MAQPSHENDGLRVLVCGSSRFQDKGFVFGLLNGFANHFDIAAILSGPFSGADQIAKEWAKEKGIPYEPINIGAADRMELAFFDDHRQIPELLVRNDPMFRKGYERLRDSAANALLVIPTPEGKLGPTSACLKRMADMVNIECIDGAEAMQAISQHMVAANQAQTAPVSLDAAAASVRTAKASV
jgi:hypothetical protein